MVINFDKIREIYGKETLEILKDDYFFELFKKNVLYLQNIGINNIETLVEINYLIFIEEFPNFKQKVDNLIRKLGENYIEILENDIDIWGELV